MKTNNYRLLMSLMLALIIAISGGASAQAKCKSCRKGHHKACVTRVCKNKRHHHKCNCRNKVHFRKAHRKGALARMSTDRLLDKYEEQVNGYIDSGFMPGSITISRIMERQPNYYRILEKREPRMTEQQIERFRSIKARADKWWEGN